jgi:hypothetical protein
MGLVIFRLLYSPSIRCTQKPAASITVASSVNAGLDDLLKAGKSKWVWKV